MVTTKRVMTLVLVLAVLGLVAAGYAAGKQKATKVVTLTPAAAAAVDKILPGAETRHVRLETEGVRVYEVTLVKDGADVEVEVAPDGTVMEVEKAVGQADLPAAVAAALAQVAGGAEIKELERTEIHAELKVVKLDKPAIVFEAEFAKDGKTVEVTIDENGKVVSQEADDDDDEDEDDDGDKEVTLEQVPAAVRAAIRKEAGQGTVIKEIEAETKNGKTVYEAEFVKDGREVEVTVAADGTVLSREIDDDDDDDD